jgi:hypothetical protein
MNGGRQEAKPLHVRSQRHAKDLLGDCIDDQNNRSKDEQSDPKWLQPRWCLSFKPSNHSSAISEIACGRYDELARRRSHQVPHATNATPTAKYKATVT